MVLTEKLTDYEKMQQYVLILEDKLRKSEINNIRLEARITELTKPIKTSKNSSKPPSFDIGRKNKSLRGKSNRKTGGQQGHEGFTMEMSTTPTRTKKLKPTYCHECGEKLTSKGKLSEIRQLWDLPKIVVDVTEYRVFEKICSCGACTKGSFPELVTAPVCYGSRVQGMCAYLSVRQCISINRIKELFRDVFNMSISEGTIVNKVKNTSRSLETTYETIRSKVENSKCVGTDETGCKVAGSTMWMWVWQTVNLTYISISTNRGFETIERLFAKGFKSATLVHDCWKAHFKTLARQHQICIAHVLRELQYFIDHGKEQWAQELYTLFIRAIALKNEILENPNTDYTLQVSQVKSDKDQLLANTSSIKDKKLITLINRLIKYEQSIFVFLDRIEVPPDNNGSERAIRNIKVKTKVSGLFRTIEGAHHYAVIRSVIDTCIKNKGNIFETLNLAH